MSENRESYADGIGEITLSGGMVRIDLVTLPVSYTHLTLPTIYSV